MFTSKMKQLIASGTLSLVLRVAFLTLVLVSSLVFSSAALAGPMPGGIGG